MLYFILWFLCCAVFIYVYYPKSKNEGKKNIRTLIVIGSGGHTAEIFRLMRSINNATYRPRMYIKADSDGTSLAKILKYEESKCLTSDFAVVNVPRSRSVNQSYFTSIVTTIYSTLVAFKPLFLFNPDLTLCNGPGTPKGMALRGIKVVEMAGLAPAPMCGMILSDFGASVIRVDKVNANLGMDCLKNGKMSLALNLKKPQGLSVIKKLISQSDVLLEPFRKGVMESLGLGPDDLMRNNPKLVYARLTGFGQNGPLSSMAGHDINFVALSGVLSMLGRSHEKPTFPINLLADFAGGGLTCALGIVLALFERVSSGKGQIVDSAMVEGTAYLGSWLFRSQNLGIWGNARGKNILDTGSHFYETYETKDGKHMSVGALEPQFYQTLLAKLELKDKNPEHFGNFDENKTLLAETFKTKTQAEWCEIFDGTDACVSPVLSPMEAAKHYHNVARDVFSLDGDICVPNPAPKLSRTPGKPSGMEVSYPNGFHTQQILNSLGYRDAEIAQLVKEGVVGTSESTSKL